MPNTKISALPAASALTGAEIVPVVQSAANRRTTAAAIAALAVQPPTTPTPGTFLLSGGQLIHLQDYDYVVTGGSGYINGQRVDWSSQEVTLSPGDPTNDRIDVFVVDGAGTVSAIAGTPAADPFPPDVDPALYLGLRFVIVFAGTTEPAGSSTVLMYDEAAGPPGEWTASASAGTVTVNSTTDPFNGTTCIRAVNATAGTTITLAAAAPVAESDFDLFSFFIKILSAWGNNRSLQARFYLGASARGNAVTIVPGQNGLTNSNLTTYQGQGFLKQSFGLPTGTTVDKMVLTVTGGTISFALDLITLFSYGGTTTIISTGGITQSEADARYLKQAANLSDLGSASAARTNLGLGTAALQPASAFDAAGAAAAVQANLDAHTGDTTDAHDASAVSFDPTGLTYITGTEVQTALEEADAAIAAAAGGGITKHSALLVLCAAFTPAGTGADTGEIVVPYSPADGTTVLAWNVRRIGLRVGTAGGAPSMKVQKSSSAGAFGAGTDVGTVTLGTGDNEGATTSSLGTVQSGNKLRFNALALGTATDWTVDVLLEEA